MVSQKVVIKESHGPASASRRNSVQGGNAVQVIDHLQIS